MMATRNGGSPKWFSGNKHRTYSQMVMRCVSPGKCRSSLAESEPRFRISLRAKRNGKRNNRSLIIHGSLLQGFGYTTCQIMSPKSNNHRERERERAPHSVISCALLGVSAPGAGGLGFIPLRLTHRAPLNITTENVQHKKVSGENVLYGRPIKSQN